MNSTYISTTIRMAAESCMANYIAEARSAEERAERSEGVSVIIGNWIFAAVVKSLSDISRVCKCDEPWCAALRVGTCIGMWLTRCDVDVDEVEARLGNCNDLLELLTKQLFEAGLSSVINGYPTAD